MQWSKGQPCDRKVSCWRCAYLKMIDGDFPCATVDINRCRLSYEARSISAGNVRIHQLDEILVIADRRLVGANGCISAVNEDVDRRWGDCQIGERLNHHCDGR